jgi:hypothetical protein
MATEAARLKRKDPQKERRKKKKNCLDSDRPSHGRSYASGSFQRSCYRPSLLTEVSECGAKRSRGHVNQPLVRRVHLQDQEDRAGN